MHERCVAEWGTHPCCFPVIPVTYNLSLKPSHLVLLTQNFDFSSLSIYKAGIKTNAIKKKSTETFKPAPGSELWLLKCVATTATEEIPSPQEHLFTRSPAPDPARWPPARDDTVGEDSATMSDTIQPAVQSAVVTHGDRTEQPSKCAELCSDCVLGLNLSQNGAFIFQQCRKLMKAWGKLAGAFNKKHLLMHLKWGEDVQSLYVHSHFKRQVHL